jgi:hypothetical protein
MDAKFNNNGDLQVLRRGILKYQMCCLSNDTRCGDMCPLLTEHAEGLVYLWCAAQSVCYHIIEDLRPTGEGWTDEKESEEDLD